jgi:dynactin complex subunit
MQRTETRIDILRRQIQNLARSVETALEDAGSNLSSLSNPSQRAYSWIKYLNQGTHLEEHISTLQAIQYQITRIKNQSKLISRRSNQPVRVELFNFGRYILGQAREGWTTYPGP